MTIHPIEIRPPWGTVSSHSAYYLRPTKISYHSIIFAANSLGAAGTSPKNIDWAAADTKQEVEVLNDYSKQTEEEGTQPRSGLFEFLVSYCQNMQAGYHITVSVESQH